MKKLVFKPMQIFAMATLVLLIGNSCKKQPLTPADVAINEANGTAIEKSITDLTVTANPFNVRVGAPVDGRTGTRWIKKFKETYGYYKTYTLSNFWLQVIVNQPNCVGISLTYATINGKRHILPVGVDVNGKIMKCLFVSTMNGLVSWGTAQQWIANDNGAINSHFLGKNTFIRLNETPCATIRVDYAINDVNQQVLLLSNPCGLNAVKKYEDRDIPCPTVCPTP